MSFSVTSFPGIKVKGEREEEEIRVLGTSMGTRTTDETF